MEMSVGMISAQNDYNISLLKRADYFTFNIKLNLYT